MSLPLYIIDLITWPILVPFLLGYFALIEGEAVVEISSASSLIAVSIEAAEAEAAILNPSSAIVGLSENLLNAASIAGTISYDFGYYLASMPPRFI